MPRVFLVDDEQVVLEGLSIAIARNLPEMEICGTARSGREAIDGVEAARPDILLLDVRMPGIDGLEALREIRARVPEVVTILLTAYERFDIAKRAFELGVYDYLVKPASQDRLVCAIRGAAAEHAKRREGQGEAVSSREALERARPLLAGDLVYSALFGDRGPAAEADRAEALGLLGLGGEECLVAVFGLRDEGPAAAPLLRDRLQAELAYGLDCVVGPPLAGRVPVVIPVRGPRDQAVAAAESALSSFLAKAEGPRAAAGLSRPRPYAELRDAIAQARAALASSEGCGPGAIVRAAASPGEACAPADPAARAHDLLDAAAAGDADRAARALDAWLDDQRSSGLPEDRVRESCRSLLAVAIWFAGGELLSEPLGGSAGELREEARLVLAERLAAARPGPRGRRARVVDEAIRYLERSFTGPVSLEETAEAVGASPAHLSRLFVDVAGRSFVDYLTRLRIDRAKELLARGETSVKAVALSSGYSDPNYFSRVFKKAVGATPSEYVEALGRSKR